jgi:Holliday junction resolvase RusA-like endonuclease
MGAEIRLKGRLRSMSLPEKKGSMLTFSVLCPENTTELKKLMSRNVSLVIAESSVIATQESLGLLFVPPPAVEPRMVVIPGQPVPKPRQTDADRFLVGKRARPCVARFRAWADRARRAFDDGELLPKNIEALTVRFYLEMPDSWSNSKRLQNDGRRHFNSPDIDNLVKAVMDALIENDEIIAELHASKFWTNGEPRTEVIFS